MDTIVDLSNTLKALKVKKALIQYIEGQSTIVGYVKSVQVLYHRFDIRTPFMDEEDTQSSDIVGEIIKLELEGENPEVILSQQEYESEYKLPMQMISRYVRMLGEYTFFEKIFSRAVRKQMKRLRVGLDYWFDKFNGIILERHNDSKQIFTIYIKSPVDVVLIEYDSKKTVVDLNTNCGFCKRPLLSKDSDVSNIITPDQDMSPFKYPTHEDCGTN